MYVNDFVNIVGDNTAENLLLNHVQDNGYNYLILYNLYAIHNTLFSITDPVSSQPLADFIEKARTMYGVQQVAGVGETYNSFQNIHDYNLDHAANPNQQFDRYNIEFEFWNTNLVDPGEYYCTTYLQPQGLTCDTSGAFQFLIENLCDLHDLCGGFSNLYSEMYIGWPNAGQSKQIADCTDRVLVHYYRTSDVYNNGNSIYNYGVHRLPDLAQSAETSVVMPIFSCEPSFMGPWLTSNPETQVFDTWLNGTNGYNSATGTWKANTLVDGYVWFKYTCLPEEVLAVGLNHFDVRKTEKGNLLNWHFDSFLPIQKVDIQRKTDIKEHFLTINQITSPYGINSTFLDSDKRPGNNFYRLKVYYEDGSTATSKTVVIENEPEQINVVWHNDSKSLFLNIPNEQTAQFSIWSASGQLVLKRSINLNNGNNTIQLDYILNQTGIYLFSVNTEKQSISKLIPVH